MKNNFILYLLICLWFLPYTASLQCWTKEEQAFLDYFNTEWKSMSNKPTTYEGWKATVNPHDKLIWWWTNEGMPKDLEATKNWLTDFEQEGQMVHNISNRPIRINIVNDIAMIWFYGYLRISNKAGITNDFEDKRLEVFIRDGAKWKFLGGMVDPVDKK